MQPERLHKLPPPLLLLLQPSPASSRLDRLTSLAHLPLLPPRKHRRYFCSSLEGLSRLLKLSPAIAGTTLLSLGNGAPDVFSSIVSFEEGGGSGAACDFGLNSILGGALFVTTVVVGVVSVLVAPRKVAVEKTDFVRDACFLLLVLLSLTVILVAGKINVWVALAFPLLYLLYVLSVCITHLFGGIGNFVSFSKSTSDKFPEEKLTIFDAEAATEELETPLLTTIKQNQETNSTGRRLNLISVKYLRLLKLALDLPRRITIPDVSEDRWSKPFAVTSAAMSPVLLAVLSSSNQLLTGALVGLFTGIAAFFTTESQNPPTKFRLPWLTGGFLMSVTWTYVTAKELVSLLVSIGTVIGISPASLGLTVLAWGDSLGDLMAAAAMAKGGGDGGVQVAVSGCYAGPTFNVLVGLGVPIGMSAWMTWPAPAVVEMDSSVFETVGFLAGGVMWALVILPRKGMRPDRVLGCGLLAIYMCFLTVRLGTSVGHLPL
ncbi:Cation/calcium exchanger 1 [Dendrobium catenatum]|uniref:Cation/calcium exchanger 1 n=1 Tax=Dendrobium catenatum TaxID=906689 RepID=A0A2I0VDI8_9ASPA|nr:Cation/calcium exchanger 1 [Dendrobium catenatum]